ncbi:anaerobic glycerol-3-phosphate dehydrogenase subunit C [Haladaptatus halobius]|uniref:anaerobic glycerol-3-phosphate dehydrogenase subunit C n=1 Tax=Haladaptatus halobius TaxID=2884875 RepID=UPI001D0B9AC5|nr:anaerobic glycerol-3-phosphate dehydrogenase subunit C [Haladaptatus halobius]
MSNQPTSEKETERREASELRDVFSGEPIDLRPGSDDCYKCSTCDTECPVAEVDDEFPGPKFQGPEQWRLKRKDDHDIDDSVMSCSNCMRCDDVCPSNVPLSQMHNTARGEYVDEQISPFSLEYVRNRILANYGRLAPLGARFPQLTNFVMGLSVTKLVNEKLLGITGEREFPDFATQTFREWWRERGGNTTSKKRARKAREERSGTTLEKRARRNDSREERGGAKVESDEKRVAYFHGDYSNYNTPEVAKAMVRVFESFGYEVAVPEQRCSGTPMYANGMLDDARRAAKFNVETFAALVEQGYDVVCSCTSCSMALRQEYPELYSFDGTAKVAANTFEALEYLRIHEDLDSALADASVPESEFGELAYHAPCHARNQGIDGQAVELISELDGADAVDVGDSCSGISGTYGWKAEKYDVSMQIGEEMFEHMHEVEGETGMTECPTCAMQMNHGTGYEIRHPLEVLDAALVE